MKWYRVIAGILLVGMLNAGVLPAGGARKVDVLDKSSTGMVVRINTGDIYYDTYTLDGKNFTRFYLKDRDIGEITTVGKPNLPVIRRLIEVPQGAEVNFEIVSASKKVYSLKDAGMEYPIMPSYPPVPKVKGAKPHLVMDRELYSTDAFWPDNIVKVKRAGIIRGHELYQIEFYPVRYNPARGMIEVISNIKLRIDFEGGNVAKAISDIARKYSPFFENMLSRKVLNYGVFEQKVNPQLPVEYLIITPSAYLDSLQSFITWKKQMGYHVTVATIPDSIPSGDTLTVKQYIQNAYNNWTVPPTFVLLVGDVNDISNWWSNAEDNPANDLGYSTLEGTDYFPDIYVGRFSATTDSMVGVIVRKVITYEKTLWGADTAWAQKAFFIASADGSYHTVAEGTHLYCMNIVRNYGMIADSLFAYYTTGAPTIITNTVNDGRALLTYSGHGSETGWADYSDLQYSVSDIYSNLTNGIKTPFEQTYACLTGSYTVDECYQEAWLRAPNKGAAAAFGSSVTSLWDEDDILQRRMFDEIFDTGYVWVMGAIDAAKMDFYNHYGDNTGNVQTIRYFQMYNLFGDPSMYIYTHVPYTFNVSHAPTVPFGTVNFDVTVSDNNGVVEGALVSAVQNGVILDAKYTDATGTATLTITTTTPDTVYITVTGYNHKPSETFAIPSGAGAYVSVLNTTIDDASGNGNGRINPGESINLSVLAKNWGEDPATGVVGYLSTSDTMVSITQDSAYFGDIASHDSVLGAPVYNFSVSNLLEDGHIIPMQVMFIYSDTGAVDTTVSNLSFTVYAPVLVRSHINVQDTLSQDNGDHVAQPGEAIDLDISIKNTGHEDIHGVHGILSSNDGYIMITRDTASYGDISAGNTATPSIPYHIVIDSACPDPYMAEFYLYLQGDGYEFYDTFHLFIGTVGYYTEVEDSDTVNWTYENPWHVSTRRAHSPLHSFYFGDEGTGSYPSNANASLITPYIKVGPDAKLSFWTWYDFENGYDYGYIEYSVDSGNTWTEITSYTGAADWHLEKISLSGITPGTPILIRFRGTSDGSVQHEGWYVDDIRVSPPEAPTSLALESYNMDDSGGNGNGFADPGENVVLNVSIKNFGDVASGVVGILSSPSPSVVITDSMVNFGDIYTDSVAQGTYPISVASDAEIGVSFDLTLVITANAGAYVDTFIIPFAVGDPKLRYTGPDAYGYYAYDMFDGYSESPDYNWIEISSIGSLVAASDSDDGTSQIQLPFTFKYYGNDYNTISVCSNGWLGLGQIASHAYSNTSMPNSQAPNNIIAGVWDDLNPTSSGSGKIYYYYDTTAHRVIVEWNNVYHYGSTSPEDFEIILYDPAYNTTLTGDGEIVIQYKTAPTQTDFTTGIENQDGSIGIQYNYDGAYDTYANEIRAQFAIKFTTDTPVYVGVEEHRVAGGPARFMLMPNFPNPFRNATTIKFAVPHDADVNLSVYDIAGRKVTTLLNGKVKKGFYSVVWNGKDARNRKVKSGIYFYVLKAGRFRSSRKMVMIR